jgi:cellulose biosynthesis protein BcsQ
MSVITIASGKGRVGKTLAAISLAAALALDVGLLDADPNRGAHRRATATYAVPHR